jgi:hypothetical protein
MNDAKAGTFAFLQGLSEAILKAAPRATDMNLEIGRIVKAAMSNDQQGNLRGPEAAFLNTYVLPVLNQYLQGVAGLTADQSRGALLNEYARTMAQISSRFPIRAEKHPFKKTLGLSAESIYREWTDPEQNYGLSHSCPDFALGMPFPHTVLFEGKYFDEGPLEKAAKHLVTGIYEAVFYRGLPRMDARNPGHPKWDYDYACLLAYDASPAGTLIAAWNALGDEVKRSFWEGANVYVMILRNN